MNRNYVYAFPSVHGTCHEMLHTDTMKRAFKRMGVELVFGYPFMEEFV